MAYRYKCVSEGDWGELVKIWERDRLKVQKWRLDRANRNREELEGEDRESEELSKLRQEVMGLIVYGDLTRAMGRVKSFGVGDCNDPAIQAQLRDKFPPRNHSFLKLSSDVTQWTPLVI